MSLGNIVDFIHSNCYPNEGYIQVLEGQKIVVVFDPDLNEIVITRKDGVWSATLNLAIGTVASSVEEIDMAIEDLEHARDTFATITAYLSVAVATDHKRYTPRDVNLGPFAKNPGEPSLGTYAKYAGVAAPDPDLYNELNAKIRRDFSPPTVRITPVSDHAEKREFNGDPVTNPYQNRSRFSLDES